MATLEEQIAQLADAVDAKIQPTPEPVDSAPPRLRWPLRAAAGLLILGGVGAIAVASTRSNGTDTPDATAEQIAEWQTQFERQLPLATASQQAAIADGVVTVTEALELAQEAADCSASAGGAVITFEWDDGGVPWTASSGTSDEAEADALFAIADDCWEKHFGLTSQYLAYQQIRPAEEQERLRLLTVECLSDAGIDAPDWPATDAEIDPSTEATCDDQAKALLDLEASDE